MWRFVGRYRKKGKWVKFTKVIDAPKLQRAEEMLYSEIGSKHRVKRASIVIESVEEVKE
ncbi:MAG TPA: 50S ribosomal protein L18a [Euryarchaeota archaeon]|nr:50S ribosomal protein L18a [Euryarchaeota archaeon]